MFNLVFIEEGHSLIESPGSFLDLVAQIHEGTWKGKFSGGSPVLGKACS